MNRQGMPESRIVQTMAFSPYRVLAKSFLRFFNQGTGKKQFSGFFVCEGFLSLNRALHPRAVLPCAEVSG